MYTMGTPFFYMKPKAKTREGIFLQTDIILNNCWHTEEGKLQIQIQK